MRKLTFMEQNIKVAAAPLEALQYAVVMPNSVLSFKEAAVDLGASGTDYIGGDGNGIMCPSQRGNPTIFIACTIEHGICHRLH